MRTTCTWSPDRIMDHVARPSLRERKVERLEGAHGGRLSRRAGSITPTAVAEDGDGIPLDGCARGPGPLAGATLPPLLWRVDRGDRRRRVARHAHGVRLPLVLPARALEGRARGRRAALGRRARADGVGAARVAPPLAAG